MQSETSPHKKSTSGATPSPPGQRDNRRPTLLGTYTTYRETAADRTLRSRLQGARMQLLALARRQLVDPLFCQADRESDPIRKFQWFSLATLTDEDLVLAVDAMCVRIQGGMVNPEVSQRRERLAARVAQLHKELKDEGFSL